MVHVRNIESIEYARFVADAGADAILLDSGQPQGAIKTLGGTGNTHDWSISREIVNSVRIPAFLAGGLTPENVGEAIRQVRPFGVDVCSGLRVNGELNQKQLQEFVRLVHQV